MVRVLTRGSMARGRVSRAFHSENLKNGEASLSNDTIYLTTTSTNELTLQAHSGADLPPTFIRAIPLAGDVQNRTVELASVPATPDWTLRLLKDVGPGEKVELWFAEDLLARLNMPFLTPNNIKGRKNYVCHECGVQFEQPNPLKLHLFLSCETFSAHKFWRKFFHKINQSNAPLNLSINRLVNNTCTFERPRSHENSSCSPEKESRCFSEPPFSAFRPYHNFPWPQMNHPLHSFLLNQRLSIPHLNAPRKPFWECERIHEVSKSFESVSVTNPAEVEAIATNWGKSKEGHLCLYCGKVYSRKYGLKIHIRTHTGYKPLQCKYCLRPFGDPSNLNKHVRLHAQSETPYNCHLCGKMLVRKRDLERHLRSRHPDDEDVKRMMLFTDSPSP